MYRIFLGRVNVRSWPDPHRRALALFHAFLHVGRGSEVQEHKKFFGELTSALSEYEVDSSSPVGDSEVSASFRLASSVAEKRNFKVYGSRSGCFFALDVDRQWISVAVPNETEPRAAASNVEGFFRELMGGREGAGGISLSVDLVSAPGSVIKSLDEMTPLVKLELTIRLPNDHRSLYEAIADMARYGEYIRDERYYNKRGLWMTRAEAERLDSEASRGRIDVRAVSANDDIYDSRDNPAEFEPSFTVTGERVAIALLLALVWLAERWPSGGSGSA
ncbi:hypothetical protein ACF068_01030 [Streptomyces sp. NPDC016309]|uniref:hypothetical protein n=1 Tax=Streptomyces sp. NPDC016309 TaxID=3364965 RepID=UPI0036FE82CE